MYSAVGPMTHHNISTIRGIGMILRTPKITTPRVVGQRFKSVLFGTLLGLLVPSLALGQSAALLPNAKQQYLDDAGNPIASGQVFYYVPSTTTKKTVWQDAAETTPAPNPVQLDAAGRPVPTGQTFGSGVYRQKVLDVNGVTIWDTETTSTGGSGGGSSPTVVLGDNVMVGTVLPWAGLVAPTNYLFTYGQSVSRTTYSALMAAITLTQQNAVCNIGSTTLSGLADTSQINVLAAIEGLCIPPGTTVVTRGVGSVTMSNPATTSMSTNVTFFPYGNGDGSTTFRLPFYNGQALVGRCNMGNVPCGVITPSFFGTDPSALNAFGGQQSGTLVTANLPPIIPTGTVTNGTITSTVSGGTLAGTASFSATPGGANATPVNASTIAVTSTQAASSFTGTGGGGSSTPFSLIQPSKTINFIIKALLDNTGIGLIAVSGTPPISVATANAVANVSLSIDPLYFGINGSNQLTMAPALKSMAYQAPNAVAISGGTITGMPTPTNPSDVSTKSYTDALASGVHAVVGSRLATTAALPAGTYNNGASGVGATLTEVGNGALTIDGIAAAANDVVLIKNEATQANNGIYTVTNAGSGGTQFVLTRHTTFDQPSEMVAGSTTVVSSGISNANTSFQLLNTTTSVGTTAVVFNPFGTGTSLNSLVGNLVLWPEPQGRLSLTSGVAVLATSVAGATTVYYVGYKGGKNIPIYNGTTVAVYQICAANTVGACQLSTALGASWTANSNWDWYVTLNSGSPVLCTGPAWATRTTELTPIDGLNTNTATMNCRINNTTTISVPANQATYVGSMRTGLAGQTNVIFGAASAGGTAGSIGLWNAYNRVSLKTTVVDTNTNWSYSSATPIRPVDNSVNNSVSFISGLAEDGFSCQYANRIIFVAGTASFYIIGCALDSTTAFDRKSLGLNGATTTLQLSTTVKNDYLPVTGWHTVTALEVGDGANANQSAGSTDMAFIFESEW